MSHYYSKKQDSAYNPFLVKIKSRGLEFEIYSSSGVFSSKEFDLGTEVMLKYLQIKGNKILDLGCGYGVVGIALLLENQDLDLTFNDVSERAIRLTKKNLKKFNLNANVIQSNIFENIDENFDLILTNPPYNAGRDICFDFIKQSFEHLNEGGSLQLVCRRRKGGDVLEAKMNEIFGNVEVIGQKSGFRLYKSVK
jgi:16S rRNA (guanine1207-N2)-methyltransferase